MYGCVSVQDLHPSCEGCPKPRAPPDAPSFPSSWRMHHFYLSLGGRNLDIRVKHLVTQPGNAPEARPSHLTTADQVNKVSEGLAFTDHRGRVLQRTQTWTETQPWSNQWVWVCDWAGSTAAAVSVQSDGSDFICPCWDFPLDNKCIFCC